MGIGWRVFVGSMGCDDPHCWEYKLIDLYPVVRDHVYHPGFHGSFSLKYILTPLSSTWTKQDHLLHRRYVASSAKLSRAAP